MLHNAVLRQIGTWSIGHDSPGLAIHEPYIAGWLGWAL
jgi:hypothetical protein